MKKEVLVSTMGIILGLLSILFGDSLWESMHVTNVQVRGNLTSISSLFLMLAGFHYMYLTIYYNIKSEVSSLEMRLHKRISLESSSVKCYGGSVGLRLIAESLLNVERVHNVRIIPTGYVGTPYSNETAIWNDSIAKNIINGGHFTDIVGGKGVDSAKQIIGDLNKAGNVKGRYSYVQLDMDLKSFLNFKILYFKDGTTELWYGWRISESTGVGDGECFRSSDSHQIRLFEEWYKDLYHSGDAPATWTKGNKISSHSKFPNKRAS